MLGHRVEQLRVFLGEYHLNGLLCGQSFSIGRVNSTFER